METPISAEIDSVSTTVLRGSNTAPETAREAGAEGACAGPANPLNPIGGETQNKVYCQISFVVRFTTWRTKNQ